MSWICFDIEFARFNLLPFGVYLLHVVKDIFHSIKIICELFLCDPFISHEVHKGSLSIRYVDGVQFRLPPVWNVSL